MKKKIALVCVILLSCCMFFVGCGKSEPSSNEFIMLSLAMGEEDGVINQGLHFSVGSEKLKANGATDLEIQEFKNRLTESVKEFCDEFYLSFLLNYVSEPNEKFQLGKALIITQPVYTKETDTVGFNMIFSGYETWNYYHKSSAQAPEAKPHYGFMITTKQQSSFPFSAMQGQISIGQKFAEGYTRALDGLKCDYAPDFVYDYATSSRAIKSDCDYSFESGLYHHIWMRKQGDFDGKITIYTSIPNTVVWYLTLLGVTILGVIVAVLVIKLRDKKRRK